MATLIKIPPPPQIDYELGDAGRAQVRMRELADLMASCRACLNRSDVIGAILTSGWAASTTHHPSRSTFDFVSPSRLRLHFSLREKGDDLILGVSSQPRAVA